MEAAAGIGGLIKAILCLQHEAIPKNLHFKTLNPRMSLEGTPFVIPTETIPWKSNGKPRRAGVSSFGISGTNAHVIVEEAPVREEKPIREASSYLLPLSAKTPEALSALAKSYQEWFAHNDAPLHHVAYAATMRRSHLDHRLSVFGSTKEEIAALLGAFAAGEQPPGIVTGITTQSAPKVVFVFPGQGSQWVGMGRQLSKEEPVFRGALSACDEAIRNEAGFSIIEELDKPEDTSRIHETVVAQPALFAIEVALSALLQSWGVVPSVVVGHSVGEIAAAHVAGMLDLVQAARLVSVRARVMQKATGHGKMVSVTLTEEDAQKAIAGFEDRVGIAAVNDPSSVVLSGDTESVDTIVQRLSANGVQTRPLRVNYAFHSPQMEALLPEFMKNVGVLSAKPSTIPMLSTVTGKPLSDKRLDAAYWAQNIRQTVRFTDSIAAITSTGVHVFVEVGPHPVLAISMEQILSASKVDGKVIPTLRREKAERKQMLGTVGALHVHGCSVDWKQFYPDGGRVVELPTYPWQHKRYWLETSKQTRSTGLSTGHPLLGDALALAGNEVIFEGSLDPKRQTYLADHRVLGDLVVPGAALLEWARAAVENHWGAERCNIRDLVIQSPVVLAGGAARRTQLILRKSTDTEASLSLYSQPLDGKASDGWVLHAVGSAHVADMASEPARLDLAEVRGRCFKPMAASDVYSTLFDQGVDLGPTFRGIAEIWTGEGEVLSRLSLPVAVNDAENYGVHPAFLDAAFQTIVAASKIEKGRTYLPFEFGSFSMFGKAPREAWVHARITDSSGASDDTFTVAVTLVDGDGQCIADITEFRVKRATTESLHRAARETSTSAECLYRLDWQPHPVANAHEQLDGTWLIVDHGSSFGDAVEDQLRTRGARIVRTTYALVRENLQQEKGIVGVVCLAKQMPEMPMPENSDAAEQALRNSVETLETIQAIVSQGGVSRFFLVTQQAQAVRKDDRVFPAEASLWGLGRVVMNEHPELDCKLVDLDGDGESALNALTRELLERSGEQQVAWRNGERFELRISAVSGVEGQSKRITENSTVLVTGGLGALGLRVARWLRDEHGVSHIVLLGRTAPTEEKLVEINQLRSEGAEITIHSADVSDAIAVRRVVQSIPADRPLRGVIHAAGVLDDGMLVDQTPERFGKVFAPKVQGAWNLHEATRDVPLDVFVMFSSASSIFGGAGQSNYAAGNAFLDGLAQLRRVEGLPGQSLNWGAWSEGGMVSGLSGSLQARLSRMGFGTLSPHRGLSLLGHALGHEERELLIVPLDWQALGRSIAEVPQLLRGFVEGKVGRRSSTKDESVLGDRFAAMDEKERAAAMDAMLRTDIARVLSLSSSDVPEDKPLRELGLDSLMAVEVRNAISARIGKTLPATLLFNYPTVKALRQYLLEKVLVLAPRAAVVSKPAASVSRKNEAIAIIGTGCRFPGGVKDPEGFWRLLENEVDAIREVPKERWDIEAYYDVNPDAPGKMTTRWGGFLDEIERFEPAFFGVSPREAQSFDPQQRLLLETTWEALERAGIPAERLMGSDTGVYVGICGNEYQQRTMANWTIWMRIHCWARRIVRSWVESRIGWGFRVRTWQWILLVHRRWYPCTSLVRHCVRANARWLWPEASILFYRLAGRYISAD
jgi:myxalamid-type polyketide synthase MxaC